MFASGSYTGTMDGGSDVHGTPGSQIYTPQTNDPCSKIKAQNLDPKFKTKVDSLTTNKVLNYDHEMGYASSYPPPGTGITDTQYQSMDNKIGTNSVRLPEGNRFFGFLHTHNNADGVVKIFSPADVMTFLTSCISNASTSGNIGDAYAMVITSEGSYMLRYTGSTSNFSNLSGSLGNWNKQYMDLFKNALENNDGYLNQSTVESIFLQFLKNTVNVNGLDLYKVDGTNSNKLSLNANNTVNYTQCP